MAKNELRKKILTHAYTYGFQKNGKKLEDILNIKKNTLDYTLEKLEKEKYFSRMRYEINFDSIGLGRFAWIFVSVNWDNFDFNKFVEKALSIPQVGVVADITGEFDLALKIVGPSIQSINSFVLGFEKIFEDVISNTKIYFANKEYKRHYLETPKKNKLILSEIDYKILCEKNQNPKLSIFEISQKLKLHRNTVSNKWKSYLENKVILKKTIELTPQGYDEIGLGLKAFIILKPCPGKIEDIAKQLCAVDEIQDLFTTLSNEIVVITRVPNSEELAYFYKKFSKIKGCIKSTTTIIFLSKHTKTCMSLAEISKIIDIK